MLERLYCAASRLPIGPEAREFIGGLAIFFLGIAVGVIFLWVTA